MAVPSVEPDASCIIAHIWMSHFIQYLRKVPYNDLPSLLAGVHRLEPDIWAGIKFHISKIATLAPACRLEA